MRLLLAALAAQAAAPPGPLAGDWLEVGRAPGLTIAIDEGATTRDGDLVRLRVRVELSPPRAGIGWGIAEIAFDCRTEAARGLRSHDYAADGRLVRIREAEALAALPPPAPSGEELATFRAACHRTGWGGEGAAE